MSEQSDFDYYSGRAAVERERSEKAANPTVVSIHAALADKYDELAQTQPKPRTTQHISAG